DTLVNRNHSDRNHSFVVLMEPVDGHTQFLTIGAQHKAEPFERINYYLNEISQDIRLVSGIDTLYPLNVVYERYYNVSPSQRLVLAFEADSIVMNTGMKLIIEDRAISTGKLAFNYSTKLLKSIPNLIYNEN